MFNFISLKHFQFAIILLLIVCVIYIFNSSPLQLTVPLNSKDLPVNLNWWDGGECSNKTAVSNDNNEVYGHCGRRSSALGPGQKVISMSVYGKNMAYFKGLEDNLKIIKKVYPGYLLRVHVNPRLYRDHLCPLLKKYDHLYVCDINNLPSGLGDVSQHHGMSWRYSPMGDPQVDIMHFRDSDSRIIQREVSAVHEWLSSKTTMHIMRDWPRNPRDYKIFGGLWGLRTDLGKLYSMGIDMKSRLNSIRETLFLNLNNRHGYGEDQLALKKIVWPALMNDMVSHDCFYCKRNPGSWPWPTKRNGTRTHVGMRDYRPFGKNEGTSILDFRCPFECRPPNHTDWDHC